MKYRKVIRVCVYTIAAVLLIIACGIAFFAFSMRPTSYIPGGRNLGSRSDAEKLPDGETLLAGTLPDEREITGEQYILYFDGYSAPEELPEQSNWEKLQCTVAYVGGQNELSIYFDEELLECEQPWLSEQQTMVTKLHGTQISYQLQYHSLQASPGEQVPAELTAYFEKDGHWYVFKSSFALQAVNTYRNSGVDGAQQCLDQAWSDLILILNNK